MFHGSMVALVTPLLSDGSLDFASLDRLIAWHIEQGTRAIIVAGTTGEAATLEWQEKQSLIRRAVKVAEEKIPIIAGTAANSTKATIELTKMAMEEGVDACLIMTPAYIKPTQEGLYQHYKAVAHAVAIPQILYNVPGRTACDLLPETVARLADIANIIGIKEATGDLSRVREIKNRCTGVFDLYSGDDPSALDFMRLGGKGVISVTANVAPHLMSQMCEALLAQQFEVANEIDQRLMPLHRALFVEANPIPTKWALHHMQLIEAGIRLPLTELSEQHQPRLRQLLQGLSE
ncbi:MAG: 4-hydroxy-tetrahydrodipicolinate synthase [Gammaproteobacteria bacterium]